MIERLTRSELQETLKPYNIDVMEFRKRGDRYYAKLGSDHRIDGEWWEDIVRKHYPIAFSTCGMAYSDGRTAEFEGHRQCEFKMRII